MELRDDELDVVTGGVRRTADVSRAPQLMQIACSCGCVNSVDVSKDSFICKKCGKKNTVCG